MKNVWSIICSNSSIDSQTNLLSLFNCIEEVKLEIDKSKISKNNKLVIPANLQLVSLWTINDFSKENTLNIKLELIDPVGKTLSDFSSTLKSKKGDKRLRSITNIQGIPITKNGRYYYRISQKKGDKLEVVSETPLDINLSYTILDNIKK